MMPLARCLLLLPALLSLPALAGFAPSQLQQTLQLAYGQNSARLSLSTADGAAITRAEPDCSCMTVRTEGSRLVAEVNTSTFDASVDKHIAVTTADGQRATLTLHIEVPQAVILSAPSLIWQRNAAPAAQELRIRIPEGSPVRALVSADLSGEAFEYRASTLKPGREYVVVVTPRSTGRRALNRLIIQMDGPDPRYTRRIVYLRVQ